MLKKKSIKHNVFNAVNHEAEATIIAQAGRFGAVTIATNMAGRGTDILLGGNPGIFGPLGYGKRMDQPGGQTAGWRGGALRRCAARAAREIRRRGPKGRKAIREGRRTVRAAASDALKRSTEMQRQVRELSPFRDERERYEDLSATELIEALHGMRPIPESYLQAKQDLEASLLQAPRCETDGRC